MNLGKKLKELRESKGLKQDKLGEIFRVSRQTYGNWENERARPSIDQLIEIADFYAISLDDLCGRGKIDFELNTISSYSDVFQRLFELTEKGVIPTNFESENEAVKTIMQAFKQIYKLYTMGSLDDFTYLSYCKNIYETFSAIKYEPLSTYKHDAILEPIAFGFSFEDSLKNVVPYIKQILETEDSVLESMFNVELFCRINSDI